ncbi:MAG: hypothetical protein ACRD3A_03105 [Terriglobales bacterium]
MFPGAAAQGEWVGSGTSSGGGASTGSATWNVTIDHTANTFSLQNVTAGTNYQGQISIPLSKFLETLTTSSNDPSVPVNTTGHSIEVPDILLLAHLNDAPAGDDEVVPLVNSNGQCPTLPGPTTFNDIRYDFSTGWDSTTNPAYGTVAVTQSGSSLTATETPFKLDGTNLGPFAPETVSCSSGIFSGGSGGGGAISPTALIGLTGKGGNSDHASVLFPAPGSPVSIAAVVAGQYTAMIFRDSPGLVLGGFGPGAGSMISGGAIANLSTDALSTHATDITITFGAGPSNGLLTGSVTDVNGVHSPMVAMVTTVNGKFQILVLTTNMSSTEPYHIFLSQQ